MEELGLATEHEMVLAFLQAEIGSERWRGHYATGLEQLGLTRALIDHADLTNEQDNQHRIELLASVRGYRANRWLFTGFPLDTVWRRARLAPADFALLHYRNRRTNEGLFQAVGRDPARAGRSR